MNVVKAAERSTESPIEQLMLNALIVCIGDRLVVLEKGVAPDIARLAFADKSGRRVFIAPQVKVGPYRADFLVAAYRWSERPSVICVECDGKEFHGIEHIGRDARRDRWMATKGIVTLRFSGGRITHDAGRCAIEVFEAVTGEKKPTIATFGEIVAALFFDRSEIDRRSRDCVAKLTGEHAS